MLGQGSRVGFIYGSKANVGHLTVDPCIIVLKSIPYIWLMLHGGFNINTNLFHLIEISNITAMHRPFI